MSSHLPVPSQLGRYRLTRLLGRGGMGAVYLAEDSALGRAVALKVPHFEGELSSDSVERFQREARMAAQLLHPNLCPVFDVGCLDGIPYFTMPFVEGTPLSQLIEAGRPWPLTQAARLIAQLAGALQVLHAHGIMHRDLKPANVMIRADGEPMLMDFGLARSFTRDSQRVTTSGQVVGTPAYMSPEQIVGASTTLGPATDIYSLGVLLYQLIAGRLPFEGPVAALFGQVLHKDPDPPGQARPDRDSRLDRLCLTAMAREPQARFASMSAFQSALQAFSHGSAASLEVPLPERSISVDVLETDGPSLVTLPDTQARPRRLTPVLAVLTAVVMLLVGVGAAWVIEHQDTPKTGEVVAPGRGQIGSAWREERPPPRIGTAWSAGTGEVGQPWARRTNSVDMELALIPRGGPVQGDFWMGRHEVTIEQFGKFIADTRLITTAEKPDPNGYPRGMGWTEFYLRDKPTGQFYLYSHKNFYWNDMGWPKDADHPRRPVMNITWIEAKAFCRWLSDQEHRQKRLPENLRYDLPTEQEWVNCCRAGTTTRYFWGDTLIDPKTSKPGCNIADRRLLHHPQALNKPAVPVSVDDGHPFTAPVGSFRDNPWGLCDMHGNLAEYCADEKDGKCVYCGGCFVSPPEGATYSARDVIDTDAIRYVGFRVVLRPK